jgi:hypothetical protein
MRMLLFMYVHIVGIVALVLMSWRARARVRACAYLGCLNYLAGCVNPPNQCTRMRSNAKRAVARESLGREARDRSDGLRHLRYTLGAAVVLFARAFVAVNNL